MNKVIALDLGGTWLRAAIVEDLKIVKKNQVLTQSKKGKEHVLARINVLIESIFEEDIKLIYVAASGFTNEEGEFIFATNLPFLGVNLKKVLEKRFKVKVKVENDANCFTVAEALIGAGKNYERVLGVTLGTGVGAGLVIDKKLVDLKLEFGHMIIDPSGPKDILDHQGDVEAFCAGPNIVKRSRYKTVKELFESKDPLKEEIYKYLGIALANAVNLVDPDVIVLGGGLSEVFNVASIENEMKKYAIPVLSKNVKVIKGKLENAEIIGAALLIKN